MKEYCILTQYGEGCPFYSVIFNSLESAKQHLFSIADDYNRKKFVRKNYYIDNDFFENKYILGLPNQVYYQIQVRTVTEWESIDLTKEIKKENGKILKFIK